MQLALLALAPVLALADNVPRTFPADAQRGVLEVVAPPEVRIDGRAARLAPGVRVYARNQLIVMSATLVGQPQVVNYRRDGSGLVRDVWLLTDAEAALKMPQQAPTHNIVFSSQVPTQAVDDGKTPYADLPKFTTPLK